MTNFTLRAFAYLVLAVIGLLALAYSIMIKNYVLLVTAAFFAFVSADNIFCSFGKKPSDKITQKTHIKKKRG